MSDSKDYLEDFKSGKQFLKEFQFTDALDAFNRALQIDPNNVEILSFKSNTLRSLYKFQDALDVADHALQLQPENVQALVFKAYSLLNLYRSSEALNSIDHALQLQPEDVNAWICKVLILLNLIRFQEALEAAERALQLDPQSSMAWTVTAMVKRITDNLQTALPLVNRALELNPNNANAWSIKSLFLNLLGQYPMAINQANKALQLNPIHVRALLNKVVAFLRLKKLDDAQRIIEMVLDYWPECHEAYMHLGSLFNKKRKYHKSLETFDRALHLKSNSAEIWALKASTLLRLQNFQESLKAVERALNLNPQLAVAWLNKGALLGGLRVNKKHKSLIHDAGGHIERTYEELNAAEKAIQYASDICITALGWSNKARALNALHRYVEAIEAAEMSIKTNFAPPEAWFFKAVAFRKLGDNKAAAQAYRYLLRLRPNRRLTIISFRMLMKLDKRVLVIFIVILWISMYVLFSIISAIF